MNKYQEVVLPIVEEANVKAFQLTRMLSVIGLVILGCAVGLLEVGTLRYIGVGLGLLFMVLPFALRFVIDKHKKIGIIRFSEGEILTKLIDAEPTIYKIGQINRLEFDIVDYEGETKARDLVRSSSTMNVRTGSENSIYWKIENVEYHYQFKLENELEKRKALHFLKTFEKDINK